MDVGHPRRNGLGTTSHPVESRLVWLCPERRSAGFGAAIRTPAIPCQAAPMLSPASSAGLAIALGANLGDPAATFTAVRPLLAAALQAWAGAAGCCGLELRWSPRYRTAPVGGPPGQPAYLNAVVLGLCRSAPSPASPWPEAGLLLERLLALEARFGRERLVPWGPRRLDLDLLWCGGQRSASPQLTLPHPRLGERSFVLAPLAAIAPDLLLPGGVAAGPCTVAERLAALARAAGEPPPAPLAGALGWPEGA